MKLYEIMQVLNDNMEAEDNKLYDFILYGCEDYNSYLKTLSVKRKEPLKDREIGHTKYVILAVRSKFKHKDCTYDIFNTPKCQLRILWAKNGYEVLKLVEFNKNLGFGDCYVFRVKECDA